MNIDEAINNYKKQVLAVLGFDLNMKYIGKKNIRKPMKKDKFNPKDYLEFALKDYESKDARGMINCLSNCKRSIDSQLDILIWRMGFNKISKKERWNFPKKIDFIRKGGVIAPRILERINSLRNELEHEHKSPTPSDIENALDATTLFVSYSDLVRTPGLCWEFQGDLSLGYDHDQMKYYFYKKYKSSRDGLNRKIPLNLSVGYGDKRFDELYIFFTKTVPKLIDEWNKKYA